MGEKETPITKYLANLERRKSIFGLGRGSQSPSPLALPRSKLLLSNPPNHHGIPLRINFDDTFFTKDSEDPSQSILHLSPPISVKRRRTSLFYDESETVDSLQKKVADFERLLRQTQSELLDSRATCTKLEQVGIDLRRIHGEKIIALETSNEEHKLKARNSIERAESMEKEIARMQRKDSEIGRNLQFQLTSQLVKIGNLENSNRKLQQENQELSQKLTEEGIENETAIQKLRLQLEEAEKISLKQEDRSKICEEQLTVLKSQLTKAQNDIKEKYKQRIKLDDLQKQYEDAVAGNEEESKNEVTRLTERVRHLENVYIKEQLTSQNLAKFVKKLEDENNLLKSIMKREHLLEEQLLSAESKISILRTQLKEKEVIEAERNNFYQELKSWIRIATKLDPSCTSPLAFDKVFRKQQDFNLELRADNSGLAYTNKSQSDAIMVKTKEVKEVIEQLKNVKEEYSKVELEKKRLTVLLNLTSQDRNSLRDLQQSYDKEFEGVISEPLKMRIEELEKILSEYDTILSDDPSLKKACEECLERSKRIQELSLELSDLKTAKDNLIDKLAEITNQSLLQSELDETTGLKIVSFGQNPSMLPIEAKLKDCIAENELLKTKLKKYEEDTACNLPDSELLKEKTDIEEKLKILERKHELLTESYTYETVQLQSASSKLFGYYVTLARGGVETPTNQFRLQSVYAPNSGPDETFIFQEGEAGELLLLDTPILTSFQDDIDRFLRQDASVPAFLAAVTITYTQGGLQTLTTSSFESQPGFVNVAGSGSSVEDSDSEHEEDTLRISNTQSFAGTTPGRNNRSVGLQSQRRPVEVDMQSEEEGVEEEEEVEEEEDDEEIDYDNMLQRHLDNDGDYTSDENGEGDPMSQYGDDDDDVVTID